MLFLPSQGLEEAKESAQITVAQIVLANRVWCVE